ncbi:MAG: mechanosensitive ion channel family protein [Oscillospiraceae bacterium]|nr:mechanosensitive ion channel family protein [Oscillospiraceae bacterium]
MPADLTSIANVAIGQLTLGGLFAAIITLVVCLLITRIVMRFLSRLLGKTRLDAQVKKYVLGALKFLLYTLTALIVADSLGIPVTSLVALLSVVSLALSLAVQDVLANVASGLVVLTTKPFHVGDYVETSGGEGTVCEISLTHTLLDTVGGQRVLVPNSTVAAGTITNYSALKNRRVAHIVTVSYDTPTGEVLSALLSVAEHTEGFLSDPEPLAAVEAYGESSIQYVLRFWVPSEVYWDAHYQSLSAIRTVFAERGIKMTYNHLNVHIVDEK